MDDDKIREALKEALKDWLDDQVTAIGWWSFRTLAVAGVFALGYFILSVNGWHR